MSFIADRARGASRRRASAARPTQISTLVFEAKSAVFRLRRSLVELGRGPVRLARAAEAGEFCEPAAASRSALWSDETLAERAMQLGKVHNLRRAAARLDGLLLPAGAVFSFWRQVGKASGSRGFVRGRMLREGCMVPATGGGLCQLSNALYDAALQSGCRIVERHAHSRIVPGSAAAAGRDATVAWNYVDLRFAAPRDLRLSVRLERDVLEVSLSGRAGEGGTAGPGFAVEAAGDSADAARSCGSCDESACFLHEGGARTRPAPAGRTAFLVDEAWPEFIKFVSVQRKETDLLGLPLDGGRWRLARYRWPGAERGPVIEAPLAAVRRAWAWRRTPPQGAARRLAEVESSRRIAQALAAKLGPDVTELVVAQSYLPFLWRNGDLGGRAFSVLMNRLPIAQLHARLDAAAAAHPERSTLADYRAPAWLAEAEAEALAAAARIVTPHVDIAALFGDRAERLAWVAPSAPTCGRRGGGVIAFPGPTVARKGAYEVREAARRLGLTVRPMGSQLEGAAFWEGLSRAPAPVDGGWLDGVAAVVQPALVEDAPRRLLEALAAGVPVIATAACGLGAQPGLTIAPAGDPAALVAALAPFAPEAALASA